MLLPLLVLCVLEEPNPIQMIYPQCLTDQLGTLDGELFPEQALTGDSGNETLLLEDSSLNTSQSNNPWNSFHSIQSDSSIIKHIEALEVE